MNTTRSKSSFFNELANVVAVIHAAIVVFFMLGWLIPSPIAWWAILLGGAGLQLIWIFYADRCPLTMSETWLRNQSVDQPKQVDSEAKPEEPTHFVASLIGSLLGLEVSRFTGDVIVYSVLYFSMALSAWRLFG